MEIRNTSGLLVLAIAAFAVLFFRDGSDPEGPESVAAFLEERQQIVESSQLWYIRPVSSGGGGMSFEHLNFVASGLASREDSVRFEGRSGSYEIAERSGNWFILHSRNRSETQESIDTIHFDTLPSRSVPLIK